MTDTWWLHWWLHFTCICVSFIYLYRFFFFSFNGPAIYYRLVSRTTRAFVLGCKWDEFQCANGDCIRAYQKCNGYIDCADGSDEPEECGECPYFQISIAIQSIKIMEKVSLRRIIKIYMIQYVCNFRHLFLYMESWYNQCTYNLLKSSHIFRICRTVTGLLCRGSICVRFGQEMRTEFLRLQRNSRMQRRIWRAQLR